MMSQSKSQMRSSIQLADVITPAAVRIDVKADSKLDLIQELSNLLVAGHPSVGKVLSPHQVYRLLVEREKLAGTGIGHGVAIPHATSGRITGFYGGCVRSVNPIDFNAIDKEPCRLFIVLLSTSAKPLFHIKALAKVSRLLGDKTARARLMEASDAAELFRVVTSLDNLPGTNLNKASVYR